VRAGTSLDPTESVHLAESIPENEKVACIIIDKGLQCYALHIT